MQGLHLTADLRGCLCAPHQLLDASALGRACTDAVQAAVTLDIYVCNFGADHSPKAHALMDTLLPLFQPQQIQRHALRRGAFPEGLAA